MSLGENLRRLRTARYLSQSDLATKAKVSKPTIQRIERGDYFPYPRTIRALADALDVDPSELVAAEELAQRGKAAA
jgi:transcriptional regulator with XRE-family HTH domain